VIDAALAGATLEVDLAALAGNWRTLKAHAAPARCAAVVKADGYGLGAAEVGLALAAAGCDSFFVAHASEAIQLRAHLAAPSIFVLHGPPAGAEKELPRHRLTPVLCSPGQIAAWGALARAEGRRLPAALHVDTGMNRLGLATGEVEALIDDPARLDGIDLVLVMSHLACAEEPRHPLNAIQRQRFAALEARLPKAPRSLANSGGIALGGAFHRDMVRPGIALYGVEPCPSAVLGMKPVVRLSARILQVRGVDRGDSVGYGATHFFASPGRVATIAVGYADGFLRSLSNRGYAYIDDVRIPVIGRVSMDLVTLDVSAVPNARAQPGAAVELIGPKVTLTEFSRLAGTIEYEILTRLGRRFHRVYTGGPA
jgi:alanine racemase